MNAVLEQIKSRRSIRKYKPDPVPQEILDQIIEAGTYAASGKGQQSAIIVQVTDRETRDKIADWNRRTGGWPEGHDPFYGAPAMLIVLARRDNPNHVYDGEPHAGRPRAGRGELLDQPGPAGVRHRGGEGTPPLLGRGGGLRGHRPLRPWVAGRRRPPGRSPEGELGILCEMSPQGPCYVEGPGGR